MNAILDNYLTSNQKVLVEHLKQLVSIPTVNPPGRSYKECVTFLKTSLESIGFETQVFKVPDDKIRNILPTKDKYSRYNLFAKWNLGKKKTIHFNAHYDVVPVSGSWMYPPFSGHVEKGVLYGRGAADMKGSISALIYALGAFNAEKLKPSFNIEVSFVCDEEIGGLFGTGFIKEMALTNADYVIVCEGASGNRIGVGHNGVLWLTIQLRGKTAHASRPQRGRNAFDQLTALGVQLHDYLRKISARGYTSPDGVKMNPTLSLGGTFGQAEGGKTNIVPGDAWFTLDRRLLPTEDIPQVEGEIRDYVTKVGRDIKDFDATITSTLAINPYRLDHRSPLPQALACIVASIRNCSPKFSHTPGFTDAHYFGNGLSIPTVGYGTGGSNYHGVNEQVEINDLLTTSRVYAEFMDRGFPAS
ncbi:MAG: Succinyl-diaminopimelate desuccinylase [Candidatus Moanabacter tarae]|uniref:Probable succinyl-diaminopimelate desuccinylase n=1 Tax=Candidatus Moanibacter tarae TaxID=2200854 RepID=A0A2Z4APH4_9BACT|nr:MAG: Succinyl-diaminopimelate desuccinylase [Candidatus Moanabacter tarae]